ncbi:hypothetical protein INT82_14625 [Mannheimia haemolytica]|nr:hypothetical protein [Mannheimia haemolytica]
MGKFVKAEGNARISGRLPAEQNALYRQENRCPPNDECSLIGSPQSVEQQLKALKARVKLMKLWR